MDTSAAEASPKKEKKKRKKAGHQEQSEEPSEEAPAESEVRSFLTQNLGVLFGIITVGVAFPKIIFAIFIRFLCISANAFKSLVFCSSILQVFTRFSPTKR